MITPYLLLALLVPPTPVDLDAVVKKLASVKAWQASFTQEYVPAGFESGSKDTGSVTVVAPAQLRFDYTGEGTRVFAVDHGTVRMVDQGNGTCDAIRLDQGAWQRLPLAALLDPGAATHAFVVVGSGATLTLTPRAPTPELTRLVVEVNNDHTVRAIDVFDDSDNRNRFVFGPWRPVSLPVAGFFQPALAGATPCQPEDP
jgi:outer membrane lipoprotein-sorting protein